MPRRTSAEVLPLAAETEPDVILLDLTTPRLAGLEVLPLPRQHLPADRVLFLTVHDDQGYLRQALRRARRGNILSPRKDEQRR